MKTLRKNMTIKSNGKIIWTNKQQNSLYFKFSCWLSFQYWYQLLLIPYHIVVGYYYGYSTKEIIRFCKKIIHKNK